MRFNFQLLYVVAFFFVDSALCYAMEEGDTEETDRKAATNLMFKAIATKMSITSFLEIGVDCNNLSLKGFPPISCALKSGANEAIDRLLPHTDLTLTYSDGTFLHEVMYSRNVEVIEKVIAHCKKTNILPRLVNLLDGKKNSPFHFAALFLSESIKDVVSVSHLTRVLKDLKEAKGTMDSPNAEELSVNDILRKAQEAITKHRMLDLGWTPLHVAIKGNDLTLEGEDFEKMQRAYLENPLGINVPNQKKTTPFIVLAHKFVKFKQQKEEDKATICLVLLKTMKEKGGNPTLKNDVGNSVQSLVRKYVQDF
jgi:ankyrin repeat protein